MPSRLIVVAGLFIAIASSTTTVFAQPARYVARMQSGAVIEGNALTDWHTLESMPKLENQALFDPSNPVRWLVDRVQLVPESPEAFVEFVTGDRLPGTVVDYRSSDEFTFVPTPSHFVVQYSGWNPGNLERQKSLLRVDSRWVRRIVWQKRSESAYEARTGFFQDGTQVRFRSARFSRGSATLLLESGIRRVSFAELAELHFAPVDFWSAYFDELAALSPDGQRRLLQVETSSGLVATTSLDRYLPRAVGDARDVNRWIHAMQPAWSLDLIWVPQATVWMRRSFSPHEVPLPRVPVTRFTERPVLGSAEFSFNVNRNLDGGILASGNREAGWGMAVHAFAELEYELTPLARSIRTEIALDRRMGEGGCVQPRILNASTGNARIYEGPVIVGSANVIDSGVVGLAGAADAPRRVVLQVDPAIGNRPPGADPLDVRDHAIWIDPLVELDAGLLKQQIDLRQPKNMPSWRGWNVTLETGAAPKWSNFYAEGPPNAGEFQPSVALAGAAIKLEQRRPLAEGDRWLVIDAVRSQSSSPPAKVSVKVGNSMATEYDLQAYDKSKSDYRPLVLPLTEARAANAAECILEIRQLPAGEGVPIYWRGLAIVPQHPLLHRLFEDSVPNKSDGIEPGETPTIALDDQHKYYGTHSARLARGESLRLATGRTIVIRERPKPGEHRFLRFAVRKQGSGGLRVRLDLPPSSERSTAIYEAGANPPTDPTVRRLTTDSLPNEFYLVTRDLFGDFGAMDVRGIVFEVPDGEQAWIDHVYLARSQNDFELVKVVSPAAK